MKKKLKKIYLKIKHWCCKVGLCNFDSCRCDCHKDAPKTTTVKNVFKPHLDEVQEDNLKKVIEKRQPAPINRTSRRSLPREERRRLKKLDR